MDEHVELTRLIDNPPARRLWLLYNALHGLPFDRAIEMARTAEAFVTGSATEKHAGDARVDAKPPVAEAVERTDQHIDEISSSPIIGEEPSNPDVGHLTATKRTRLTLPAEQRDRLLDRLAEGAKNGELATEFGLSLQQVQGIRIGCARDIAKRRDQRGNGTAHSQQVLSHSASMEEIIRYLRQQDDVVVPQENGQFLVNGRFHMPLADLAARANRMRARQRKPAFELIGDKPGRAEQISPANGHPLFWDKAAPAQPRS
jgi:hypothetical protein